MIFYLTPQGQDAVREYRQRLIPSESPNERYHRLYKNELYKDFTRNAEAESLDSLALSILLSEAAIDLCSVGSDEWADFSLLQSERITLKTNIRVLASCLEGKGVNVNMAAIRFLMLFHPKAIDLYFRGHGAL